MQHLGRYKLGHLLGSGGAGQVYEAQFLGLGGLARPVALKLLHNGTESLRREARIGGLLRHRHLVDVYEIADDGGQWFCAMELCPGGSLSQHIPLPPKAVVEVGHQVCAALQYAHEELGLVHLDIKPDNLLLSEGTVKVEAFDRGGGGGGESGEGTCTAPVVAYRTQKRQCWFPTYRWGGAESLAGSYRCWMVARDGSNRNTAPWDWRSDRLTFRQRICLRCPRPPLGRPGRSLSPAPADPDVRISRIRLLRSDLRCVIAPCNSCWWQRVSFEERGEVLPIALSGSQDADDIIFKTELSLASTEVNRRSIPDEYPSNPSSPMD